LKVTSAAAAAVVAAVEYAAQELGGLDILVNNAGIAAWRPLEDFQAQRFDRFSPSTSRRFVATQAAARQHEGGRTHHQHRQHQCRAHAFAGAPFTR